MPGVDGSVEGSAENQANKNPSRSLHLIKQECKIIEYQIVTNYREVNISGKRRLVCVWD